MNEDKTLAKEFKNPDCQVQGSRHIIASLEEHLTQATLKEIVNLGGYLIEVKVYTLHNTTYVILQREI